MPRDERLTLMAKDKDPAGTTPTLAQAHTLKRGIKQRVVRQNFTHGRSKAIVVEKVKRRAVDPQTKYRVSLDFANRRLKERETRLLGLIDQMHTQYDRSTSEMEAYRRI